MEQLAVRRLIALIRPPGLLRRWFARPTPAVPEPVLTEIAGFDAIIDLGPRELPAGVDPAAAVRAVKAAVSAMPGANWINIGRHDGTVPGGAAWVRVFAPGSSASVQGADWVALRAHVSAVVRTALKDAPVAKPVPAGPDYDLRHLHVQAGGFADGAGFRPVAVRKNSMDSPLAPAPAKLSNAACGRIAAGEASALDDNDLAAALLSLVLPGDTAPLAARAVAQFGSFAGVLSAPVRELQAVSGLGTHSVAAIKLVHAAALRASQAGLMHRLVLDDMTRLTDYLGAVLARERIEQFRVLFLDDAQCLIADEAQARGTVNHTPVYPREVVRRAIELRAAAVVLVHNHPSGDPTPSREDVEMTATVRDAAALLGIEVRDHIIVGNGQWVSLRELQMM